MAKKIVLGCLVVLVVGAVAGGLLFYKFVYQPGREMIGSGIEAAKSFSKLDEIQKLDADIDDQSDYAPPADGVLSEAQVGRFVAVQRHVRDQLGPRWEALEAKYKEEKPAGQEPRLGDILAFWRDLGDLATEAKRAQVEGIDQQEFSRQEYAWVRRQVYLALGQQAVAVTLEQVRDAAKEGGLRQLDQLADRSREASEQVPPENRERVEPYREELLQWAPLAALGL